MKTIVVYDSWTGNTKKVAEAIAQGNNCAIFKVDQAPLDLIGYDLLILGTPDIRAKPSDKISAYLKNVVAPKKNFLFMTYGAPIWGKISSFLCLRAMRKKLKNKGSACAGSFACPGFHLKFKTYSGRPSENDLKKAIGSIVSCKT